MFARTLKCTCVPVGNGGVLRSKSYLHSANESSEAVPTIRPRSVRERLFLRTTHPTRCDVQLCAIVCVWTGAPPKLTIVACDVLLPQLESAMWCWEVRHFSTMAPMNVHTPRPCSPLTRTRSRGNCPSSGESRVLYIHERTAFYAPGRSISHPKSLCLEARPHLRFVQCADADPAHWSLFVADASKARRSPCHPHQTVSRKFLPSQVHTLLHDASFRRYDFNEYVSRARGV